MARRRMRRKSFRQPHHRDVNRRADDGVLTLLRRGRPGTQPAENSCPQEFSEAISHTAAPLSLDIPSIFAVQALDRSPCLSSPSEPIDQAHGPVVEPDASPHRDIEPPFPVVPQGDLVACGHEADHGVPDATS